jgi:Bacterial regulatory proteins, gntR family
MAACCGGPWLRAVLTCSSGLSRSSDGCTASSRTAQSDITREGKIMSDPDDDITAEELGAVRGVAANGDEEAQDAVNRDRQWPRNLPRRTRPSAELGTEGGYMIDEGDLLLPIHNVAPILRISPQALWRLIHAGELEAGWDGAFHCVPRKSLAAYLEGALARTRATTAEDPFADEHPVLGYMQVAWQVRRQIEDGTLNPTARVHVARTAAETEWSKETVRKAMAVLVRAGYLRRLPATAGYLVAERPGNAPDR